MLSIANFSKSLFHTVSKLHHWITLIQAHSVWNIIMTKAVLLTENAHSTGKVTMIIHFLPQGDVWENMSSFQKKNFPSIWNGLLWLQLVWDHVVCPWLQPNLMNLWQVCPNQAYTSTHNFIPTPIPCAVHWV